MTSGRWLDHRKAIDCRGRRFEADWTGAEFHAMGPVALNEERARILQRGDADAATAYDAAVRAAAEPAITSATNAVPLIKAGVAPGKRLRLPAAVRKRMGAPAVEQDAAAALRVRGEAGREILVEELERRYGDIERPPRERLFRQFEALRDDVLSGRVKVGTRWPGLEQTEIRPVRLDHLSTNYPADPHQTLVELPSQPLRMTLLFYEPDILRLPLGRGEEKTKCKGLLDIYLAECQNTGATPKKSAKAKDGTAFEDFASTNGISNGAVITEIWKEAQNEGRVSRGRGRRPLPTAPGERKNL
jgi:hypothetical protein